MHVCVHTWVHVCVAWGCVHGCAACMHVYMGVCVHGYMSIRGRVCMDAWVRVCMDAWVHVCGTEAVHFLAMNFLLENEKFS